MRSDEQLLKRVAEVYNWLDLQTRCYGDLPEKYNACGRCCDFDNFDHRLFVTVPESVYLAANIGAENIQPMPTSRCPYSADGKCTVYEYRFAGCRIFCRKADADFQSRLSESALSKFKSICTEFQVPYRYSALASALKSFEF